VFEKKEKEKKKEKMMMKGRLIREDCSLAELS